MEGVNLRDPTQIANRIYVGHLNESIGSDLLDIKFSPYGKIVGILRTTPTFAFIQFDQPSSAQLAIESENGSFLGNTRIMVKAAEMKSQQKHKVPNESNEAVNDEPMNKKYFSDANEYYGNNSIMGTGNVDSEISHCEIVVVSRAIVDYAEEVERRLKMLGIKVDMLFPHDSIAINKILGNIQNRGALYGVLVTPTNKERQSITVAILYGDPQEHRNMPLEDAIKFIYKDFVNKTKGLTSNKVYQHPDAIQTLLKTLHENRSLTVLQYDHIIKYLSHRREVQVKYEIGEDASNLTFEPPPQQSTTSFSHQTPQSTTSSAVDSSKVPAPDLQKKILDILSKKTFTEKIAQQLEQKTKLSQSDKDNLKQKVLRDERVKLALSSLKSRHME
ncbi:hypothetical protein PVAND_005840 [Polypedilum vanderplanki]|uniref:RRM domain-containing protein n=1 Tax=Polypedilum vanderplanki TaxID=319348 RepID=A0A9J6C282_POLVA|nr:hypothetical protein PVAND_005840 [Polypedilum vanderplanki]